MALMTQVGLEFIARNRANRQISSFNRSVQMMGRQLMAVAGLGGGVYLLNRGFRSMIKAASDAQEIQSKFNVVFAETAGQANQWAESFGGSVGRAQKDVKSWMATLQDTFVPLGFARKEAFDLSKTLTTLAVDVASFNNAADADVIRDFTSALVGNHETVRKYGIIISETAIRQEALRQGINKTYKELTDMEKVQLRYSLIQRGTTDAQGDALRTADSYANQLKRLSANFDNLKVSIGEKLLPSLTELLKLANENKETFVALGEAVMAPAKSILYLIDTVKALEEVQKQQPKGPMPSWGPHGFRFIPPPEPEAKLELSPRGMQRLAEMRARIRQREELVGIANRWLEPAKIPEIKTITENLEVLSKEQAKAQTTMMRLTSTIDREIEITGRLGEAHWHAAKMVEFEEAVRQRYPENVARQIEAIEQFRGKLKELEQAQRLAKIADTIGESFASAFERMIFEAEKFGDVMKSLIRDIARVAIQQTITQPLGLALSGAMSGFLGGLFAGGGGTFALQPEKGPVRSFQHGGMVEQTGLIFAHVGETITPAGAEGGKQLILNVYNQGPPMQIVDTKFEDSLDERIITVVCQNAYRGGPVRHMVQNIIRSD